MEQTNTTDDSVTKPPATVRKRIRLNIRGPITILGCAAQGCPETLIEGGLLVDEEPKVQTVGR